MVSDIFGVCALYHHLENYIIPEISATYSYILQGSVLVGELSVWGNLEKSFSEMMLMIYSLLLICSVSPLLYASHGGVCSVGSYCPAGVDCSSNSSLCQAGVCNTTTADSCIEGMYM